MTEIADAIKEFRRVQERLAGFGAADTEPSSVFAAIVESLAATGNAHIPATAHGWDLYEDRHGVNDAALELCSAAQSAVAVIRTNPVAACVYLGIA